MYLGQQLCDVTLEQLRVFFGVGHVGTVSHAIQEMKALLKDDREIKTLCRKVINHMNVIQEI